MASCSITPIIPAQARKARSYFFLNTGTPGVRFLQYDEPTEGTFRELFEAVGFISDCRDTAKKNEQGFVVCAKDTDSEARDSTPDSNGYTKAVLPHQLPNVYAKESGCGIEVVDVINTRNCCDGTAKDFEVTNTMIVDDNNDKDINDNPNPIEVTQSGPGCDTSVFFNPVDVHNANGTQVEPGKVVVCEDDTESQHLSEVFTTGTPCTTKITAQDDDGNGSCKINIDVVPFLCDEIRMFGGKDTVSACFPSGVGQGQYEGWYLCNGDNGTIDLQEKFITGYKPLSDDHGIIGFGAGDNRVELSQTQTPLRAHTHEATVDATTLAASSASSEHKHRVLGVRGGGSYGYKADGGSQGGGLDWKNNQKDISSRSWYTGDKTANGNSASSWGVAGNDGAHTHTITGSVTVTIHSEPGQNGTGAAYPVDTHENRPEFIAVAYIQYKGKTLCDDLCCPPK